MPIDSAPREHPVQFDLILLLLTVAGGSVDVVLITGFHVLTAAQTGNTVLLGAAIALDKPLAAIGSTVSVVAYIIGTIVGDLLVARHRRARLWPSAVGTALTVELIPLFGLLVFWHLGGAHPGLVTTSVLIACAASAMGIQSAAVLRLGKVPSTTYVTGTLTTFATNLVRWLNLAEKRPEAAGEPHDSSKTGGSSAADGPWIYGLSWFAYAAGAVIGGLLFVHIKDTALLMPIGAIILAAAGTHRYTRESIPS